MVVFKIDTSFDSKSTHLSIKTKVTTMKREEKKKSKRKSTLPFTMEIIEYLGEREKAYPKKNLGIQQSSWVLDKNDDGSNKKKQTAVNLKGLQSTKKKDLVVIRLQLLWSDRPPDHRLTKEPQWIETDNATNRSSISWCGPKQINIGVAVNPVGRVYLLATDLRFATTSINNLKHGCVFRSDAETRRLSKNKKEKKTQTNKNF